MSKRLCERRWVGSCAIFLLQGDRSPQKRRTQKRRNPLRAVIAKGFQTDLTVALTPQRRHFIERKNVTDGLIAETIQIEDAHRFRRTTPYTHAFCELFRESFGIRSQRHRFWCQQSRRLVMSVTAVHSTPVVDH